MKNTEKIMHQLTKHSDLIGLFFAVLSFALLGVFKAEYYTEIFSVRFNPKIALIIGILTALLIEGTRFSLMLSSAEDARQKNASGFFIGALASIGLLIYDITLCAEIGAHWNKDNAVYINILQFIAVLGSLLEFRLCLLMKGQIKAAEIEESDKHTPDGKEKTTTKKDDGTPKEENIKTHFFNKDVFLNGTGQRIK